MQVSAGQKKLFGSWFKDEAGASPSWLFVAPTDKTRNKKAIVKIACIPVGKHADNKHPVCHAEIAVKYAKIYLAIEKLAEDCGLTGRWWSCPLSHICMHGHLHCSHARTPLATHAYGAGGFAVHTFRCPLAGGGSAPCPHAMPACTPPPPSPPHTESQKPRQSTMHLGTPWLALPVMYGAADIIPKIWVEWVDAVIPDVGYHVR